MEPSNKRRKLASELDEENAASDLLLLHKVYFHFCLLEITYIVFCVYIFGRISFMDNAKQFSHNYCIANHIPRIGNWRPFTNSEHVLAY